MDDGIGNPQTHRRRFGGAGVLIAFVTTLVLGPVPAAGQVSGDLTATEVDFYSVMTTTTAQWPIYEPHDVPNTPIPPPGTGQILFDGGEIIFPQDWSCSICQQYATVVASLQATEPACHDNTATVTISVQVENLGPTGGRVYSGALRLIGDGAPADWVSRTLASPATTNHPVGTARILSVTASVPADDLIAGRIYAELDLETIDSRNPKNWRADQFEATYAFDTSSCAAGITIEKSGSGPNPLSLNDPIDYTFLVTNTGDWPLENVAVSDPLTGLSAITCTGTTLGVGESLTCTASYTVIQADVTAGFVQNTATATGDPPVGPSVSAQDSAAVPPTQLRRIQIIKTAGVPDPDGVVTYTFDVTNTGNVALGNVEVTDPLGGLSAISCDPLTSLAPSQSIRCTATRTLTQMDVDAGFVSNTATVDATGPGGEPVSDQDTATVSTLQAVGLSLDKSGSGPDPLTVGETVTYTFEVTNTGQLQLTGVAVTDPLPGLSAIDCQATTLAPGASTTCTAVYSVTQADVDAGFISNTATVVGTPPNGMAPVSAADSATVPPSQIRGIDLEKTAIGPDTPAPGATITFSFIVTNTGNVALSNVVVTDPLPGLSAPDCPSTILPAGGSMTCTATYAATQADVDAGSVTNTATASGQPPSGPIVSDPASVTVPLALSVPTLPPAALALLLTLLGAGGAWGLGRRRLAASGRS